MILGKAYTKIKRRINAADRPQRCARLFFMVCYKIICNFTIPSVRIIRIYRKFAHERTVNTQL